MTFRDAVRQAALAAGLRPGDEGAPEPLAHLDYAAEQRLKSEALRLFWSSHGLPGSPSALVPAPRPRGYRATTKRAARFSRQGLFLAFANDAGASTGVSRSLLDAPEHVAVYDRVQKDASRPGMSALAAALNYVIVRGTAPRLAVILNLRVFDGKTIGSAKRLGEALQGAGLGVGSVFLFLDPTASDYYLEARRPAGKLSWKRLFGPDALEVRVAGRRLRFPPVAFSQVNEAMLPDLVSRADELLGPLDDASFLDLYCGYGLFSVCLGARASQIVGVDSEGPAIEAARENARHAGLSQARFVAGRLTGEFVESRVRAAAGRERALLDPPRQGTAPGVVEAVAARRPEAVLHVFCGTDEMPAELTRWARAGYSVARAVPLDLFPGTANLETLVLLRR